MKNLCSPSENSRFIIDIKNHPQAIIRGLGFITYPLMARVDTPVESGTLSLIGDKGCCIDQIFRQKARSYERIENIFA